MGSIWLASFICIFLFPLVYLILFFIVIFNSVFIFQSFYRLMLYIIYSSLLLITSQLYFPVVYSFPNCMILLNTYIYYINRLMWALLLSSMLPDLFFQITIIRPTTWYIYTMHTYIICYDSVTGYSKGFSGSTWVAFFFYSLVSYINQLISS